MAGNAGFFLIFFLPEKDLPDEADPEKPNKSSPAPPPPGGHGLALSVISHVYIMTLNSSIQPLSSL